MAAESEYVSIPMRLTVGSESLASTLRELIKSSRKVVICWTFCCPMLPDESRANMMSEPRTHAANNTHHAADTAAKADDNVTHRHNNSNTNNNSSSSSSNNNSNNNNNTQSKHRLQSL